MTTEIKPAISRVWVFNINRREYRRDEKGRSYGAPIWRSHWEEQEVVSETSRSWVTRWGVKVPKKGGRGIAFSEEEIEQHGYVERHKHKIGHAISRIDDYILLKRVADLIGYEAGE